MKCNKCKLDVLLWCGGNDYKCINCQTINTIVTSNKRVTKIKLLHKKNSRFIEYKQGKVNLKNLLRVQQQIKGE